MGMKIKTDTLGRFVIPAPMRKELNIRKCDYVDVDMRDGKIIIVNHTPVCAICKKREELTKIDDKFLCAACLKKVKELK